MIGYVRADPLRGSYMTLRHMWKTYVLDVDRQPIIYLKGGKQVSSFRTSIIIRESGYKEVLEDGADIYRVKRILATYVYTGRRITISTDKWSYTLTGVYDGKLYIPLKG